jgi:hypothetical protein
MLRYLVIASVLVMACAACDGTTDGAEPPTSPASTAPSSSQSVPGYLERYSPEERAAYDDAVAAYTKYVARDDRLLAEGETTRAASRFYRRYSIDWVSNWASLGQLANNDVTVRGHAKVIWTRPKEIALEASPDVVVLRQCLDQANVVVVQGGQKLEQPQFKTPHVFQVRLEKRADESWWRAGSAAQGAQC